MELNNSARLLILMRILFEETDEHENELSLTEIIEKLKAKFPHSKFDKRTIHNVKRLTSKHIAKTLPEPFVLSDSSDWEYELVKINIDAIHQAIANQKIITYQYGKYNIDKMFVYSRGGNLYNVEPYGLVWHRDFYYLIARFIENDELRHYRIDRMRHISITEERFDKVDLDIQSYVNSSFHMFTGEEIRIKIAFHIDLFNVVLDRFGFDVNIQQSGETSFILTTKAKLSVGLKNWILTWGSKAKVLEPDYLVKDIHQNIRDMLTLSD